MNFWSRWVVIPPPKTRPENSAETLIREVGNLLRILFLLFCLVLPVLCFLLAVLVQARILR